MIFARKADDALASLVKEIEKAIDANQDKKLAAFVNLIGEDRDQLEQAAEKFIKKYNITKVPIVVPVEYENGPKNFNINPEAEVTVMLYRRAKVEANHAFAAGELARKVQQVLADLPKILN